ncbi:TPA: hypothetical protein ACWV6Y_005907, partial [Salmonella enterica subsp. enterica serovar Muenchen]
MREGGNPFFLSAGDTDAEKDVAGSAFMAAPSRRDVAWWFSTLRLLRCDGLCRASILAGPPSIQGFAGAAAVTRSFLRQPRSSGRSSAQIS